MEQSPSSEVNSSSANKEIPRIFYRTRRFITLFLQQKTTCPILRQINPVQSPFPFHFWKIYFNIIVSSTPIRLTLLIYLFLSDFPKKQSTHLHSSQPHRLTNQETTKLRSNVCISSTCQTLSSTSHSAILLISTANVSS